MNSTAIIISYNNGDELFDCLNAVLNSQSIDELIVFNNGNTAEFLERLRKFCGASPRLSLINSNENIGFGAACNRAAHLSNGENLIFLNPDANPKSGAIKKLLNTLQANENSIIGGLLLNENGSEQQGPRRGELTIISAMLSFLRLSRPSEKDTIFRDFNQNREELPNKAIEVQTISGGFFAIRKSDFQKLNGFDERYFLHVEDIDLCKRHRDLGGKVLFEPNSAAFHIGGASGAPKLFVQSHKFKSFMRYFWTHSKLLGKISTILIAPLLWLAIVGRAFISWRSNQHKL